MFCKHCGAHVDLKARYCSNCGYEVADKASPQQARQDRKMPKWLKFFLGVGIASLLFLGFMHLLEEDIAESVEGQLAALRSNKITEAYYSFTSKDFQNATSLDIFREFVKTYPAFSLNHSLSIENRSRKDGIGILDGILTSHDGDQVQVQYKLVKEGDRWKVLSIQLLEPLPEATVSKDSSISQELFYPVQEQLKALRSGDFVKAYQFVSKDFAADTPIEKFEAFLRGYPVFLNFNAIEYENYALQGNRGDVTVVLHGEEGPIPAEYKLVKEDGKWKLWSLKLFLLANESHAQSMEDASGLVQIVQDQLKTLVVGNYKKGYENFVSNEFKSATSLDDFEEFIKHNPIITNYTSLNFQTPTIGDKKGHLQVELKEKDRTALLEYTLEIEDGNWKILGMHVAKKPNNPTTSELSAYEEEEYDSISKKLLYIIGEQLDAIRDKDLMKAYHDYTSEGFQKVTSLKEFIAFIEDQPAFYDNRSSDLNKLTFNNNIGTFTGTLTSRNSKIYSIEYDMIKEDNQWKILHILISPLVSNSNSLSDKKGQMQEAL